MGPLYVCCIYMTGGKTFYTHICNTLLINTIRQALHMNHTCFKNEFASSGIVISVRYVFRYFLIHYIQQQGRLPVSLQGAKGRQK